MLTDIASDTNSRAARVPFAVALGTGTALLAALPATAQEARDARSAHDLPTIVVIGEAEGAAARQPGAVTIVTPEALQLQQPRSTEEVLRTVPGVTIKPEEENAIVANIGI